MKLKFLLRVAEDLWSIKNKKCVSCKHLVLEGELSCEIRKENSFKTNFYNTCNKYEYLRAYKELK